MNAKVPKDEQEVMFNIVFPSTTLKKLTVWFSQLWCKLYLQLQTQIYLTSSISWEKFLQAYFRRLIFPESITNNWAMKSHVFSYFYYHWPSQEMVTIVCCEAFIHYSDRCVWKQLITKTRSIVHSGRLSTLSIPAGCDPFVDFREVAVAKRIGCLQGSTLYNSAQLICHFLNLQMLLWTYAHRHMHSCC